MGCGFDVVFRHTVGKAAPGFLRSPHYHHLAGEGIEFAQARSASPVCVATRMSIMTGQTPFTHGMFHNGKSSDLLESRGTLPALLGELGYHTQAIGKMHFQPQRARHGFDDILLAEDYYREMQRAGHAAQPLRHGIGQNEHWPAMSTVPEALTLTSWIAEQSLHFIRERRDPTRPFFLWTSFGKPHIPLDPPEPYYSMYRDAAIPEPVVGDWEDRDDCPHYLRYLRSFCGAPEFTPEHLRAVRIAYYGLCTQIDYNIGRMIAGLLESGQLDNTLILFTSDHGDYLGDHRYVNKGPFHEVGCRVPFLLRLPKAWEDRRYGSRCDALVTHADILPTFVRAAGGTPPERCDGHDLVGLARGETPGPAYVTAATGQSPGALNYLAITDGQWKYIYYPEGAAEQLFDLCRDPQERHNLLFDDPRHAERRRLRALLIGDLTARKAPAVADGDFVARPCPETTERDWANARWVGYQTEYSGYDARH